MSEQHIEPTAFICASAGYWARAETRDQALIDLGRMHNWTRGDKPVVTIYRVDPEAFIDEWARIHHRRDCPPKFEGTFNCRVVNKRNIQVGESI